MEYEFEQMALKKGWAQATQIDLLLTYIENQQSHKAFIDYLLE
ncbi:hypothetical protein AB6D11_00855 [Vibrio splendidus]